MQTKPVITKLLALFGGIVCALPLLYLSYRLRSRTQELLLWAVLLIGAALVYVGLVLFNDGPPDWLLVELYGLALFASFAWFGLQYSAAWLAAGWLCHIAWNLILHPGGAPGYIPEWYGLLSIGFDLMVAGYLAYRAANPPLPGPAR